jgi:hypothetical protein
MSSLLNFKVAAPTTPTDQCIHAGNLCFEGSLLRECTIVSRTSCEYFNDPTIAPKCFVKIHHENYQKEIAELLATNKIKKVNL